MISYANQLTGFYMRATLAFNGLTHLMPLVFSIPHENGKRQAFQSFGKAWNETSDMK